MKKSLFIFGTRPEAIKMAPMIRALDEDPFFEVSVCVTAQHREMLDQILSFFDITPDFDLDLMAPNQTLIDILAKALAGLKDVIAKAQPDLIIVQGDTTTTLAGALAGYYSGVEVVHLEAGLRSGDKYSPFPEEGNRLATGHLANYHFAPTERARANLADEGLTNNVWVVGNTGIDSLFQGLKIVEKGRSTLDAELFAPSVRIVLITGHRRESFGEPFENFCRALKHVAEQFPDVRFIYPVHLNPNVQKPVSTILGDLANFKLIAPLDYPDMIQAMKLSTLMVTDSGGIQEEAPSLGKPVLVTREVTERQEGVEAGASKLVGTDYQKIVSELTRLLTDEAAYTNMANVKNPYGDGTTCIQIRDILKQVCS